MRLLVNARAGRGPAVAGRLVARWTEGLGEADAVVDHRITASVDEARAAVDGLSPGDRVVVAGGDGSVQALLGHLVDRRLELAVLPCGSGNDFAAALGWRRADLPGAVAAARRGAARDVDLMRVRIDGRDAWAASSVTIGFDAAVAARATTLPRAGGGLARYLAATLLELARLSPQSLDWRIDDGPARTADTLFASVLNTPTYGGGMPMAPGARVDDGRLDVVIAGRFGRLEALAMLPRVLVGRHLGHPRVQRHAVRRFAVRASDGTVAVGIDGEPVGRATSVEVEVIPGALRAVVATTGLAQ